MEKRIEAIIGLEVHAQLKTSSKIFATSSTEVGHQANSLADPVTLGLPGCLPVLNRRVVDFAIKLGLACHCEIQRRSIFARKHYHYPDLPKGYQISQYEQPICSGGRIDIQIGGEERTIGLTRIHLEEDAGKNIHHTNEPVSSVDLNRSGVPLAEIVSEPDIRSPEEAGAYMRQIRQILRYLDISDGNMEEGSLRCDANVSVRYEGETEFRPKVEVKNINSFRFVEKALEFEIKRQTELLHQGQSAVQETRLWDENKNETRVMRSKEHANDYRYFPDPDLLPLEIDNEWIDKIKDTLPELPHEVYARFQSSYDLDLQIVELLTEEKFVASYYDAAVATHNSPVSIANWIATELFGRLNKESIGIEDCPISPENLGKLVCLIDEDIISGKIAKIVFDEMFTTGATAESVVQQKGLQQISDRGTLENVAAAVLDAHPEQLAAYKTGKTNMFGFFVGQVMKETQGKANPKLLSEILEEKLKK